MIFGSAQYHCEMCCQNRVSPRVKTVDSTRRTDDFRRFYDVCFRFFRGRDFYFQSLPSYRAVGRPRQRKAEWCFLIVGRSIDLKKKPFENDVPNTRRRLVLRVIIANYFAFFLLFFFFIYARLRVPRPFTSVCRQRAPDFRPTLYIIFIVRPSLAYTAESHAVSRRCPVRQKSKKRLVRT